MLRSILTLSLLFGATAFAADPACPCGKDKAACAQAGCTCGGGMCPTHAGHGMRAGPMAHKMPVFDAATVTTVQGKVVEINRVEHQRGFVGVHVKVKVGDETIVVHAGPSFFIDPKLTFAVNDEVQATGSKLTFEGAPTLLATTITKNGKTVELRKADGTPLFRRGPGQM
jgi:hypothetical protein